MEQSKVGEEIRKMPVEPLLPVEKKLIGWSLGLGVVLLVVLIVLTRGRLSHEPARAAVAAAGRRAGETAGDGPAG